MDIAYLGLASRKSELTEINNRISVPGLSLANKDVFIIQSNICSTKLTQNGMLNKLKVRNISYCSFEILMSDQRKIVFG
jgi:hypothetical protein